MESQTLEQEQSSAISFPEEIIEQIFSRLPVKSILRFRSVSKQWLSFFSTPSFTNLHSTLNHRTALFISARDRSNGGRHLFSGGHDGGPTAHIMSIDTPRSPHDTEAQHSNGLVRFTYGDLYYDKSITLVLNPSTHKFVNLPHPPVSAYNNIMCNLFGFDESTKDHKILNISQEYEPLGTIEVTVFSFSSYSWRKIDVDLFIDISYTSGSVCVNSAIHLMLRNPLQILAFDLTTDKFFNIKIPPDAVPQRFIKINGLLGIVCYDRVWESNEMCIWILRDYEKRVWVKETVGFPGSWINMGRPLPVDCGNIDEVIFLPSLLSEDLIEVPIYNMKSRCFKSIQLTLDQRFIRPEAVVLEEVKCYVESLIPFQDSLHSFPRLSLG